MGLNEYLLFARRAVPGHLLATFVVDQGGGDERGDDKTIATEPFTLVIGDGKDGDGDHLDLRERQSTRRGGGGRFNGSRRRTHHCDHVVLYTEILISGKLYGLTMGHFTDGITGDYIS